MDRDTAVKMWEEAWNDGIWYASWQSAIAGMNARQAAWKPEPDRHSVWQIINHIMFWQDYSLRTLAGDKPSQEEVNRRNWEGVADVSDRAWEETQQRFRSSYQEMLEALRTKPLDRIMYHIPHESYHMGQIMYLRALQGFEPIE